MCINYDKAYFADNGLAVPQTLEDLTKPEYAGLLVVQNPATSSTGLAFLLASNVQRMLFPFSVARIGGRLEPNIGPQNIRTSVAVDVAAADAPDHRLC